MNIYTILALIFLFIISYVINSYLILYISIELYTTILIYFIIIFAIDSYNLIVEKEHINNEYISIHKLLELQLIENTRLQKIIKQI
jgi:hypothetical protein